MTTYFCWHWVPPILRLISERFITYSVQLSLTGSFFFFPPLSKLNFVYQKFRVDNFICFHVNILWCHQVGHVRITLLHDQKSGWATPFTATITCKRVNFISCNDMLVQPWWHCVKGPWGVGIGEFEVQLGRPGVGVVWPSASVTLRKASLTHSFTLFADGLST